MIAAVHLETVVLELSRPLPQGLRPVNFTIPSIPSLPLSSPVPRHPPQTSGGKAVHDLTISVDL